MIANGREGLVPAGLALHFKHVASRYGYVPLCDLVEDRLRLVDKDTGEVLFFRDAEHLIASGWAVD